MSSLPLLLSNAHRRDEALSTLAFRRAFTLVELLVSITILIVIVTVLTQVLNASALGWRRAETRTDAFREARAALSVMARDISQTVHPVLFTPAKPLGSTTQPPEQPLYPALILDRYFDPDKPSNPSTGQGENWDIATKEYDSFEQIHCLTVVASAAPSDLCAVSYFCRWAPSKTTTNGQTNQFDFEHGTYTLARRVVGSTETFNRFKAFNGKTLPCTFLSLFARSANDPAKPLGNTPSQATNIDANDLAAYIWDLQFRVDTNLRAQPAAVGSPQTPAADHATPSPRTYALSAPYPNALPTYVEIRFKAISSTAGARLRGSAARETWTDTATPLYRTAILPNVQQFVLRVPLNNVAAPTTANTNY